MHKVQISPYSDLYSRSVNVGFKLELLTAHQEFNQEKALQGENTRGEISNFESFLSTVFIGLPFIQNVCISIDNLFKVYVIHDCHIRKGR